jgi:hypothetical protein
MDESTQYNLANNELKAKLAKTQKEYSGVVCELDLVKSELLDQRDALSTILQEKSKYETDLDISRKQVDMIQMFKLKRYEEFLEEYQKQNARIQQMVKLSLENKTIERKLKEKTIDLEKVNNEILEKEIESKKIAQESSEKLSELKSREEKISNREKISTAKEEKLKNRYNELEEYHRSITSKEAVIMDIKRELEEAL